MTTTELPTASVPTPTACPEPQVRPPDPAAEEDDVIPGRANSPGLTLLLVALTALGLLVLLDTFLSLVR
jgi:hypothetical protein